MEFYGPRLERLEDCDVRDDDIEMSAAEALEAMIIHRECHPAVCIRRLAASRIIGVEEDRYSEPSNVIPLPTRIFETIGHGGGDHDQHRAPTTTCRNLDDARRGLHRHTYCDDSCDAKKYYRKSVKEIARGPSPTWNIWRPTK